MLLTWISNFNPIQIHIWLPISLQEFCTAFLVIHTNSIWIAQDSQVKYILIRLKQDSIGGRTCSFYFLLLIYMFSMAITDHIKASDVLLNACFKVTAETLRCTFSTVQAKPQYFKYSEIYKQVLIINRKPLFSPQQ